MSTNPSRVTPDRRPDRASRGGRGVAWPGAPRPLATDLRRTSKSGATAAFQSGVVEVTTITARRIKGHRALQTSLGYCSKCPHQTTRPTPTLAQRSSRTSRVRGARSASASHERRTAERTTRNEPAAANENPTLRMRFTGSLNNTDVNTCKHI